MMSNVIENKEKYGEKVNINEMKEKMHVNILEINITHLYHSKLTSWRERMRYMIGNVVEKKVC